MSSLTVLLNPTQRQEYVDNLLRLEGLSHVQEDPKAAYCAISLTQTPDELKNYVQERQNKLMSIMGSAGITAYDPATAPYSPDLNITSLPNEVYQVDSAKIAGARYFTWNHLLPSSGAGVEHEKAKFFNRICIVFLDKKMRVSRMQPHRTIYLNYSSLDKQRDQLESLFMFLNDYEPGLGIHNSVPVLLGFHKHTNEIIDLEEIVYKEYPELQYTYDGTVPILKLRSENPELFYEHSSVSLI